MNRALFILPAVLVYAFLCCPPPSAYAEFQEGAWEYYRELNCPSPDRAGFAGVAADAALYEHCLPGLEDLRVIGADGEEVPYVILTPKGKVTRTSFKPAILNRAVVEGERRDQDAPYIIIVPRDGRGQARGDAAVVRPASSQDRWQEFVVDFGRAGRRSNRLELQIPDRNFRRLVRVYGSDDARDWRLLKDGILIFDFSGDVHVRELTLNYPESIFQYLKIEIGMKGDEEPLQVQGAEIDYTETEPARHSIYRPVRMSIELNPESSSTDVLVDLGGRNIPVERLILEVADPEFYRKAVVFDSEFKRPKKEGTIYRYSVGGYTSERLVLELGEMRLGEFGIRIVNNDNRPLQVTGVSAEGVTRAVVFRPPAEGAKLFYGNPQAKKPVYDLAQLFPKVAGDLPPLGEPGRALKNPLYSPGPPEPRDYSWLIWPLLFVAVVVMAFIIFRHVGQLKEE